MDVVANEYITGFRSNPSRREISALLRDFGYEPRVVDDVVEVDVDEHGAPVRHGADGATRQVRNLRQAWALIRS